MTTLDEIAAHQQTLANTLDDLAEAVGRLQLQVGAPALQPIPDLGAVAARFGLLTSASPGGEPIGPNPIIGNATVDADAIAPGAVSDASKFASTIVPPQVVGALPTLPNAAYPNGCLVFLTTDQKLYRNAAGTWSKAVDGADIIADTITAGAIAAGAIGASEIAAGAITADKLAVGSAPARNMLVNSGFRDGATGGVPTGWLLSNPGGASMYSNGHSDSTWTLRDGDVPDADPATGPYGSTPGLRSTAGTSSFPFLYQNVPVMAGERYSLSGFVAPHRATGAYLEIGWLNASGAQISAAPSSGTSGGPVGTQQTPTSGNWHLLSALNVQAPATAASAQVRLVLHTPFTSGSDCYAFFDHIVFVHAATVPDWSAAEANGASNSDGSVLIDATGITISNGKLTFLDSFGNTQLDGGGFGASWLRFLASGGFYNSDVAVGGASALTVSEVGGGSGAANYKASLSPELPYWVVEVITGGVQRVSDANASAGIALQMGYAGRVYQDLPIRPGLAYGVRLTARWSTSAGPDVLIHTEFRTADHQPIAGTDDSQSAVFGAAVQASYVPVGIPSACFGQAAPPTAAYMRVSIHCNQISGELFWVGDAAAFALLPSDQVLAPATTTLTTSPQTIISLGVPSGRLLLFLATIDFQVGALDPGYMVGQLSVNGVLSQQAIFRGSAVSARGTVAQHWLVTPVTMPAVAELQVYKTSAAGVGTANALHTSLAYIAV